MCWGLGVFVLALVLGQVVFSPVAAAQTVPPAPGNVVVELGGFKSVDEIGLTGEEGDSDRQLREGGKILKVSWDEVVSGSPTGYRVQWREASASDWSAAQHRDVDGASTTSYQIGTATDGLLANGTAYEIRVYTRYGANGLSDPSSVVSATPLTANQQFHLFVEEIVERANAAPNKMPWMRAGFENMPFVGDTEYRDFRVANPGSGAVLSIVTTHISNFSYIDPVFMILAVEILANEGGGTIGHELHHAYFILKASHGGTPNDIPAGDGIALSDAVGYLYLRELVATNTRFSGCGPTFELFADLAGSFVGKTLVNHVGDGGYWHRCGRSPSGADKALFSMFDEIFTGEVPDWFYTRFRGADGVWQRSELNALWEWVLRYTFGTDGGDHVYAYPVLQGFNGLAGREYFNPHHVVTQFAESLAGLRSNENLNDEEKKTQIANRQAEILAEVPNPWQHMYPPLAPRSLTTDTSVANQVTVSWEAPENEGHDDVYQYEVTLNGVCARRQAVVTDLTALAVVFSDVPAGDYDVSVLARNTIGADSSSRATAPGVAVAGQPAGLCVSVWAPPGDVAEDGGTKTVTVELARPLTAGETVEVPLTVSGVGADDFILALDPVSQTGVALHTSGADSLTAPRLVFTTGAEAATLVYTSSANHDLRSPLVSIGFGAGMRAPSATGVAESLSLVGAASFVVVDDDTGAVPVPDGWALKPSGLSYGDRFRLLFKTSTSRDARSADIADTTVSCRPRWRSGVLRRSGCMWAISRCWAPHRLRLPAIGSVWAVRARRCIG